MKKIILILLFLNINFLCQSADCKIFFISANAGLLSERFMIKEDVLFTTVGSITNKDSIRIVTKNISSGKEFSTSSFYSPDVVEVNYQKNDKGDVEVWLEFKDATIVYVYKELEKKFELDRFIVNQKQINLSRTNQLSSYQFLSSFPFFLFLHEGSKMLLKTNISDESGSKTKILDKVKIDIEDDIELNSNYSIVNGNVIVTENCIFETVGNITWSKSFSDLLGLTIAYEGKEEYFFGSMKLRNRFGYIVYFPNDGNGSN